MSALTIFALALSLAAASPQEPENINEGIVVRREVVTVEPEPATEAIETVDETVYTAVEQMAEFPGGQRELMKWIGENIIYPSSAQENGIQGRVIVRFTVKADGNVANPVIVRGVDPALDKEAIRLVKKMPKWKPGKNNGIAVNSLFTLPVNFKLSAN